MAHSPDITDPIPYALSNPQTGATYAVTGIHYDVAIGAQPFFLETSDTSPYRRVTAQYRKQQLDTTREPGEQTLTGWWLRSQSSFHLGQGIKFFEPQQDESLRFQFTQTKGCNIWEKGQVTLLKDVDTTHTTTAPLMSNGRPFQMSRSIRYSGKNAILLWDGYDVDKVDEDGTITHFIDYNAGVEDAVYAICDDGVYAFWVTNDAVSGKLQVWKKLLTGVAGAGDIKMFETPGITVTNAVIEYTKERLVMAVNNKVYEFSTSATALPTAVYTHPTDDFVYSSISSSGAAIYLSGYSGIQSTIQKYTLVTTTGAMPTLSSAITAAELPAGEIVYKIYYYLGFMAMGTNLGLRIAAVSDQNGSLAYGPLLFESEQPVYDVAGYDRYLWCTTNVDGNPGVTRVDLGQQISSLVFAYAWDLYDPTVTDHRTTSCAFAGTSQRLIFTTGNNGSSDGKIYIESADELVPLGELRTGFIRYNTLEHKIFKFMTPRFDTTNGGLSVSSIDSRENYYNIGTFQQGAGLDQIGIPYPAGPQQYIGFQFTMSRSNTDNTKGPLFTGYQINVLPSIPRQRLIQYPVMCYDSESDRFNNKAGYEGSAYDRMSVLEQIENIGDTVRIQDFRTGESYLGLIEEMDFINKTPTDKRFSGYGGVLLITIRSI